MSYIKNNNMRSCLSLIFHLTVLTQSLTLDVSSTNKPKNEDRTQFPIMETHGEELKMLKGIQKSTTVNTHRTKLQFTNVKIHTLNMDPNKDKRHFSSQRKKTMPIIVHNQQNIFNEINGYPFKTDILKELPTTESYNVLHKQWIDIKVVFNTSHLQVCVGEESVHTVSDVPSGIHLVVLHERYGKLLLAQSFSTSQPAEAIVLREALTSIQPRRIVIIVALPEAARFLYPVEGELRRQGCKLLAQLALMEGGVAIKTQEKVIESVVTSPPSDIQADDSVQQLFVQKSNEFRLSATIPFPRNKGPRCLWYNNSSMSSQRHLCENFEGFSELCRCHPPPLTPNSLRVTSTQLKMNETIPIVISTKAGHTNFLYRMLIQLFSSPGGGQTPLLIHCHGESTATKALTQHFNITLNTGYDKVGKRTVTQLIARITRQIFQDAFVMFPEANKVIMLEDDILVSPDIISYFHATAWLLDADPTLQAVSANRFMSLPGRGLDPTVVLRGHSAPDWGTMVSKDFITTWAPSDGADWDYFKINEGRTLGHHVIFPELSRSLHAGSAGTHVTGLQQATKASRQAANILPNVTLKDLNRLILNTYKDDLHRAISNATPIPIINPTPCEPEFLSNYKQDGNLCTYVFNVEDVNTIFTCLDYNNNDNRESFEDTWQLKEKGKLLYIILCPNSPFCKHMPTKYLKIALGNEVLEAANALQTFRRSQDLRRPFRIRRKARSILEEGNLKNTNLSFSILGYSLDYVGDCLGIILLKTSTNSNTYSPKDFPYSPVASMSFGSKVPPNMHYPLWLCGDTNVISSDTLLSIPRGIPASLIAMMNIAHLPLQQTSSNEFTVNQFYERIHMDRRLTN